MHHPLSQNTQTKSRDYDQSTINKMEQLGFHRINWGHLNILTGAFDLIVNPKPSSILIHLPFHPKQLAPSSKGQIWRILFPVLAQLYTDLDQTLQDTYLPLGLPCFQHAVFVPT